MLFACHKRVNFIGFDASVCVCVCVINVHFLWPHAAHGFDIIVVAAVGWLLLLSPRIRRIAAKAHVEHP